MKLLDVNVNAWPGGRALIVVKVSSKHLERRLFSPVINNCLPEPCFSANLTFAACTGPTCATCYNNVCTTTCSNTNYTCVRSINAATDSAIDPIGKVTAPTWCEPKLNGYTCHCAAGSINSTGNTNCLSNDTNAIGISECSSNPCQNGGTCTDYLNSFVCTCPAVWTNPLCDLSTAIWEIMNQFNGLLDLKSIQDVAANPSIIVDAVPFIAAMPTTTMNTDGSNLTDATRPLLSWTHSDLFIWATYEGVPLDVTDTSKDIISNYDYTLGNCFTFNGNTSKIASQNPNLFKARLPGMGQGWVIP